MIIESPIEDLKATSVLTIRKLKSLNLNTYFDLLNYFPYRFENFSLISKIQTAQAGEKLTLVGTIADLKNQYTKRRLTIQKLYLTDETGLIEVVWYNQPYLFRLFKKGDRLAVAGEIKLFGHKKIIEPVEYEIIKDQYLKIHTGRYVPYYPEKKGLSSRLIREKIFHILKLLEDNKESIFEFLPQEIVVYNKLISENQAYHQIHLPKNLKELNESKRRLAFDELFLLLLSHELVKKNWQKKTSINSFRIDNQLLAKVNQFIASLPFNLTNSQRKVVFEIINDFKKTYPMNRFLYGDVGAGKTVVAAIASYISHLNGYQTLFMAPTEILASQHYQTLEKIFDKRLTVSLLTGSCKPKREILAKSDIVLGTQALIQKKVNFDKVGLVIVDEQHRFGVKQRALLRQKGVNPHLLTMSATPIPRTLFLTFYGELDLSTITELPQGRRPVKTYVVPPEKRMAGYQWIREKIQKEGVQVYIICPLIEESEIETLSSVKAAKKEFRYLSEKIYPDLRLGLLHGRMKSNEKEKIMGEFKDHQIDILVTTSVIEVGIDVANANIILIEGADRFGLAQLHQLRGRVGRSDKQAYCFLFSERKELAILKRLNFFAKNLDGIALAEYDLKHRGPGEVFGLRQHGFINLKIASLTDFSLIEMTKKAVSYLLFHFQDLNQLPNLVKRLESFESEFISRD